MNPQKKVLRHRKKKQALLEGNRKQQSVWGLFLPLFSGCWGRMCRCSAAAARRSPPAREPRRGTAAPPRRRLRAGARWPDVRCSWRPVAEFRFWKAFCPRARWVWESGGRWRPCWRSGSCLSPGRSPRSSASSPPPFPPPACAKSAFASRWSRSNSAPSCRRSRCGSRRPPTWPWGPSRSSVSPPAGTWRKSSSRGFLIPTPKHLWDYTEKAATGVWSISANPKKYQTTEGPVWNQADPVGGGSSLWTPTTCSAGLL